MNLKTSTVIHDFYNLKNAPARKIQIDHKLFVVLEKYSEALARIYFTDELGQSIPPPKDFTVLDIEQTPVTEYVFCWTDAYFMHYKNELIIRLLPQRIWTLMTNVEADNKDILASKIIKFDFKITTIQKIQIDDNICIILEKYSETIAILYFTDNSGQKIPPPKEIGVLDVTNKVTNKPCLSQYVFCHTDSYFIYYKNIAVLRLLPERQWALICEIPI